MTRFTTLAKSTLLLLATGAVLLALDAGASAQPSAPGFTLAPGFALSTFALGSAIDASAPDSLEVFGSHVFVGYANNSDSAGGGGSSTIAQYTTGGVFEKAYSLLGGNDGLRVNPQTGNLWVLQNQDGNANLQVLNPATGVVTPYTYNVQSTSSGYDDIVFKGNTAYLSATNPAQPTDPVLYQTSATLPAPGGIVPLTPILNAGNLADTDSLTLTPGGDLLLDDQGNPSPPSLTRVTNPGASAQSVSVLDLVDTSGKGVSVDDTRFAGTGSQQLLIADTKANAVYALTGPFTAGGAYTATKGSGYVGSLNLTSGVITPIAGGLASPHGLAFAPVPKAAVPEASPLALLLLGLMGVGVFAARRQRTL